MSKNYYTYVYAHSLTGLIHNDEEHKNMGHLENDCYAIKHVDVTGKFKTAEEVEDWLESLRYDVDTGNYEPIDHIQLDKDFKAWFDKRQLELYGDKENGKE